MRLRWTAPDSEGLIRAVEVVLNKTSTTNVKLDVGANVETVEVSASAATIDTTTASVQNSFSAIDCRSSMNPAAPASSTCRY